MTVHLAQVNIGRPTEPLESPRLVDFVAALEPVNALADESPGFVWRLQTEDGDATGVRIFDHDSLIMNMSVWESLEALRAFVYSGSHVAVMRRRHEWFESMDVFLALWWVPAGHLPSVAEAEERIEHLRDNGPTPHGFTFRQSFPPGGGGGLPLIDDRDACPA